MSALQSFDILIKGGSIVNGTGAPRFQADVGIVDDKIAAVGPLTDASAGRIIDASNKIVAPGFIDVHTHDDRILMTLPTMDMKVSQGVTSVVVGNCGISLAPLVAEHPPPPLDLIAEPGACRFETFSQFLQAIDMAPAAVNAAFLVGHSTLRVGVMDSLDRAASAIEIKKMRSMLEEGLASGAIGFSTGLFYKPAAMAPTEEVVEIAMALKAFRGRYVTHMRDEGDDIILSLEETFRIGQDARSPVIISHHKVHGRNNFGRSKETLACIDKHLAGHHHGIAFDVYPYVASSTVLKDDSIKVAERVLITWSKARPELAGRELSDIADELNCDIYEAAAQLQPAGAIYFAMEENDVQRILQHPHAMIGSDGLPHDEHPHPRLWGTFPRVLGHYCRDLKLFPLEEAVRRMTGYSAKTFGLKGRGLIADGYFADITVFDEFSVLDSASFECSTRAAKGIEFVLVNGRSVWENGATVGNRPGRVLRHGG
ncbi:MAG: D-aminoacylase [Rhodospirillaceae bacterium]|nr:D-aminoacylase [Rhodospirillaceae bacterium]|tara:strand:- start:1727 stop:3178 length:1452 start_codon:yes stop_codon:yes gene_type:complete